MLLGLQVGIVFISDADYFLNYYLVYKKPEKQQQKRPSHFPIL